MFKHTISNTLNCNGQYYEHFVSGGNDTTVNDSKEINKKLNLKTNINRSMVVKSIAKLINTAVNEVAQSNSAEVINSVAASNSISMIGVKCDTVNYGGFTQSAQAQASAAAVIRQKTTNSIKTNITNSITKKITDSLPNDVADIQKKDNEMAKQFMDSTPGLDPNAAKKLLDGTAKGGFGNDTTVNTSYKLNQDLTKTLDLDESFKVDDNDEVSNDIKNTVSQKNIARCSAVAAAANNVLIADIKCKNMNVTNIKQKAIALSTLSCAFDQKAVNKISTKIMNKLDKTFSKMYAAAKNEDSTRRIAAMGLALGESIRNASNPKSADVPDEKQVDDSESSEPTSSINAPKLKVLKPISEPVSDIKSDIKSDTKSDTNSDTDSDDSKPVNAESNIVVFLGTRMTHQQRNYIIYGIIGFIVVIVLIIIMNL
jgi:hypothetical protein|uniref:Uncharacterized protein n=1 Tax=viral metagenome TaxID=1070528 RepID=A0A6C0ITB8_9ZZZZ